MILELKQLILVSTIMFSCLRLPAFAQWADIPSAGAPGSAGNSTYLSGGTLGPSMPTSQSQFRNSGFLQANTALQAPASGMMSPFPSGQFPYGFPNSGWAIYRGPYYSGPDSSANGGLLPPTATSSVDLNIVDLGGGIANYPMTYSQGPGFNQNQTFSTFPGQGGNSNQSTLPTGFPGN